jgi:hypothetical protein
MGRQTTSPFQQSPDLRDLKGPPTPHQQDLRGVNDSDPRTRLSLQAGKTPPPTNNNKQSLEMERHTVK